MISHAHAKINLSLEVLGRRRDGFHEIVSVMQSLAVHDVLSFELSENITLACDCDELAGESNLVLRAARLLRDAGGTTEGAAISLVKHIPLAAGLGGGSSDAAATLSALRCLWNLPLTRDQLLDLAAALGSDVPFFFYAPTALAGGRGEHLQSLPHPSRHWVVLAVPRLQLSDKTRRLYAALTPQDFSGGQKARAMAAALACGEPIDPDLMVNAFEPVALRQLPAVRAARDALLAAGAPWARLSGTGPALYTLFEDRAAAQVVYEQLAARVAGAAVDVLLTETATGDITEVAWPGR